MKYLHIVPGADDVANGMARVARLLAVEQGDAQVVDLAVVSDQWLGDSCEEVWVHGMWLPKEWAICRRVLRAGKRLVRMTHGSLSPVYLKLQGRWKKWLVGPIERSILRRCERIVATCDAEKAWIEAYLGKKCPEIVVEDVKRFFKLGVRSQSLGVSGQELGGRCLTHKKLNVLYLGRRHPLKGLEYLEQAVKGIEGIELRIVSNAFGEELEKVWAWCDVLVLPTLSENFGLVVAEALERGKLVITTDGAPAWGDGLNRVDRVEGELGIGFDGRLIYLKGYRDGSDEERVELLKKAILFLAAKSTKDDYENFTYNSLLQQCRDDSHGN